MSCDENCPWHERFDRLTVDVENLEVDLTVKRRQISLLQRKLDAQDAERVEAPIVHALFEYWRLQLRNGRTTVKLGEKRRKAIQGRLREGHTPRQLMQAIDGALFGAFEKDGKRYDDLELICRDEVKVDSFIARYWEHQKYVSDYRHVNGVMPPEWWPEEVDISDRNMKRIADLNAVRAYLESIDPEPNHG